MGSKDEEEQALTDRSDPFDINSILRLWKQNPQKNKNDLTI